MRWRDTFLVGLVASVLLAGCSADEPTGSADQGEGAWPLTGLPGYPDDDQGQVVTVKVDDTASGHPQLGIEDADLVVQEMVEGGVTRLAVMFHSKHPQVAGPVRSMRETDIGIVLPTGGTLAASGGAESTIDAVQSAGIPTSVEGDPGFSRDSSRPAPYNVMLDVPELAATLPPGRPPAPFLTFGGLPDDVPGEPAAEIDLEWPAADASFAADPSTGLWARSDLSDASGWPFTNVIALTLPVVYQSGKDSSGAPIPTMVTEGSGPGIVATDGRVFEVEWAKASPQSAFRLTYVPVGEGTAGEPVDLPIPPGRSWLALLPEEGGSAEVTAPASPSPSG